MHFNIKNILKTQGFETENEHKVIYISLYKALKESITKRVLNENSKLPPTRILAQDLRISRSTVLKAYDLLVLEKYIKSIPGSGYFVATIKTKKIHHNLSSNLDHGKYPSISKRARAFERNIQIINKIPDVGLAFRPGLPPLDIFPVHQWQNLTNNYWKTVTSSELSYSHTTGLECLRNNISNYLKIYRNINCEADQILITTGSLHSLYLASDSLVDKNDEVIVENPTYPYANGLFNSLEARIIPAGLDDEGILINNVKCNKPKLIYTTPSAQFPTGIKMSINRRLELLKWASNKNAIIIEDDYDHEFSNWVNPISSLFSLDREERVIYLGTFNKLLHPSIRLGYMIIPRHLLRTINTLHEQSYRFVSPTLQKILSAFIEKDFLNKHLRKVIETSMERKKVFFNTFNSRFENEISLDSNRTENVGLHVIGDLKEKLNDLKLTSFLSSKGITTHSYSSCFIHGKKKHGLIMGYNSINNKLIKDNIDIMHAAYIEFLKFDKKT